ncbi:MAG: hypothetical protein HFJ43_01905 [Clostridia bacterium]|nr:hypothetical protein [Clostridia bacterium]
MSKDDINNIDEPEDQEKENEELEDEEVDNRQSNGVEDDVTSVWDEDDEDEQSDAKNKKSNSKPKKKDKNEEKKEDKDDDSEEKEKSKDDKKNDEERKQDSKGNNSDDVEKNTNNTNDGSHQEDSYRNGPSNQPNDDMSSNTPRGQNQAPQNRDELSNTNGRSFSNPGTAGAEGETAGAATSGAAEGGQAASGAAGTAAAEGAGAEAAGTAAASGAGSAAASGASSAAGAAGTAGAAGAGAAGIGVIGIILIIIIIIIILIGVFGFLTAIPSMTLEKLKELVMGIWDNVQGYFIGIDHAAVNEEDVIEVAQYLYDMGYDLEGCGFVEDVEFEEDDNGNSTGTITGIKSSYLTAYLAAENRTYLISNDTVNLKSMLESITKGKITDGMSNSWGSGMIHIDNGIWSDAATAIRAIPAVGWTLDQLSEIISDVSVNRETNTLKIARSNMSSGLAFWNWRKDVTYYNLAGWSGRYGKPFELLISLHLATMAPDFAYEIANNTDLDTKVNIGLKKANFKGTVKLKTADGITYTVDQLKGAGYSDDTIKKIKQLERDASNIKTKTPYIKSVEHHWFRDVYFDTDGRSVEYAVEKEKEENNEEDGKKEKEDTQYVYEEVNGERQLKTTNGAVNVYETTESSEQFNYTGEIEGLNEGDTIIFEGTIANNIVQKEDGVRGVTNPTTKKLFNGEYYIYDGTIEKAESIRSGKEKKQKISFNKESLSAFSILEHETSVDAQLIYRDLKELLVELNYFDYSDFEKDIKEILEWPIPEYKDSLWPDRKIEKQVLEYGTLIASKSAVNAYRAKENGEEYIETEETEENNEEENKENSESLDGFIMIGDSWTVGLEQATSINTDGVTTFAESGWSASQWLSNYDRINKDGVKGVIVFLGLNDTQGSSSMKQLLDKLKTSYSSVPIYVLKVPHVGKTVNNGMDPLAWNKQIDDRNSEIQSYCSSNGIKFIDTTEGLVDSDGYLSDTYNSGGYHLKANGYQLFYENVKKQVKNGGKSEKKTEGFDEGLDVIAMGKGKVVELVNTIEFGTGVKIELTENTDIKGYYLIIAGLDVEVSVGDELEKDDVVGKTNKNSIVIMLIDLEKANVENVEEYIKVPKKSSANLAGDTAEEKVWLALIDAGYSEEAAAAAMGNIYGESGFDPAVIEKATGEGFGLCQWSYGRKTQLQNFARSRGVEPSDIDLQVEFLLGELQPGGGADGYATYQFSGYENERNIWMSSTDIEESTRAFCDGFERPGAPRYQVRIDAARRYYEKYAS